jgi:hypothetical protein
MGRTGPLRCDRWHPTDASRHLPINAQAPPLHRPLWGWPVAESSLSLPSNSLSPGLVLNEGTAQGGDLLQAPVPWWAEVPPMLPLLASLVTHPGQNGCQPPQNRPDFAPILF